MITKFAFALVGGVFVVWWLITVVLLRLGQASFATRREYLFLVRTFWAVRDNFIWQLPIHIMFLAGVIVLGLGFSAGNMAVVAGAAAQLAIVALILFVRLREA